MDLKKIALEIRDIISEYQKKHSLTFVEDTHTYFIKNNKGEITSDMPSVSSVLKAFYNHFDSVSTKSFQNCEGDRNLERSLLTEWGYKASYATNMGSRVHYILEKELVGQYGAYKEVRQPIFECDEEQTKTGDAMITAGKNFIDLMHQRGAVLLDTEMVLGSIGLGYFGQPDKVWLMLDKQGNIGIVITDWKTNKKENMSDEIKPWTKNLLYPFSSLIDNALSHYKLQLPLYAKLLLHMLKGTKYADIKFLGCVIVHLTDEASFNEYRVSNDIINSIMDMDVKRFLKERSDHIKKHKFLEQRDKEIINS
jgi:hypothetical protein